MLELVEIVSPDLKHWESSISRRIPAFSNTFGWMRSLPVPCRERYGLKCGGYLIIDRTEALTVIDVNTGKYVGRSNLEDTVHKTNMEAADEIARQLRLPGYRRHHYNRFY